MVTKMFRQTNADGEEFLSKWLALELAPTIFGNKPSTILSLVDTKNRPILTFWKQYGPTLLDGSLLTYFVLKQTASRLTILFYREDMLQQCIGEPEHRDFLLAHGYPVDQGLAACLTVLKRKFTDTCPHEFGILLGIPLQDVLGFMGLSDQPLYCKGCWHIYGNPECSLAVMKRFHDDRELVAGWLESGWEPCQILAFRQSEAEALVS